MGVELMKRYTTLGMATDQGRVCGVMALGVLADATAGRPPKPAPPCSGPSFPVTFGALAGPARGQRF